MSQQVQFIVSTLEQTCALNREVVIFSFQRHLQIVRKLGSHYCDSPGLQKCSWRLSLLGFVRFHILQSLFIDVGSPELQ